MTSLGRWRAAGVRGLLGCVRGGGKGDGRGAGAGGGRAMCCAALANGATTVNEIDGLIN